PDGILYQVSLLQFDERQRLVRSVQARRAVYLSGDQANQVQRELNRTQDGDRGNGRGTTRWQLEEGNEARFRYAESGRVEAVERNYFPAQQWELDLSPDFLQVLIVDADKMAMSDLWRYAQRFERQGQNASLYYLSFWKKTLQPLTTAVLVLVDRKSTRLNSSHVKISYAVFCLKKKKK